MPMTQIARRQMLVGTTAAAPYYDHDPVQAEGMRRRVYDMLAVERVPVQGFHYPFPALAHVEKTATGYREIPVIWNPTI
jgi:hypothetical protein